jgi:hypothetical protein
MELNITKFFNETCPRDYSASVAEIGNDAGPSTWRAACDDSEDYMLLDDNDKRDAFRAFVKSSGGWSEEEIAEWSDVELNALCLQWIAGDIRECLEWDVDDVWLNYRELAEEGTVPSDLFKADDGQVYFSLD